MSANSVDKEKLLRETEAMLRAVLISSPRGVRFEKLLRDYMAITGKTLPFEELGYPSLENFLLSIPSVARTEKGPDGEWIVKGVASDADQHVAKMISKQKKPSLRKSAKSMIAKKRDNPPRNMFPVRKPVPRPPTRPARKASSKFVPPRMQRQQQAKDSQGRNNVAPPGNAKQGKGKEGHVSVGCGELFTRATNNIKPSQNKETTRRLSSSSKDSKQLTVRISNNSKERNVMAGAVTPPKQEQMASSGILDDMKSVKWMRLEISKVQNGLWSTRLEHLYKEKFKKTLPPGIMEELKFRPDIAVVEEPIVGRFLLYPSRQKEPLQSTSNQTKDGHVHALPCNLPDVGTSITVYISHRENPSSFFVSRSDSISGFLSEEIQKQYKSICYNAEAIPSVLPGQIFCAKFSDDGHFYRARVLEVVDSKHVHVLYVDFGNKEVIAVEQLRVLINEFQTQPVQAYECCLDGVQPTDQAQGWSEDEISKFDELTSDKDLRMSVHELDDKVLSVSLVDVSSELDVAEEMKKAGLAVSTKNLVTTPSSSSSSLSSSSGIERPSPRKENVASRSRRLKSKSLDVVELPADEPFVDVFVCNITGTYNVYLRVVGDEYSTKLETIQENMTCYYSDSKDEVAEEPEVGDMCAMISDEVWCRVKVTKVNDGKIQVFFVDHGDTIETTKSELRPLASQFKQLPGQVFQCALNGLPKTKNPDVVDKLKKLIMGEVAVAEVVKKSGDVTFIELVDTRSDANLVVNAVIRKLVIPDEELKPALPKVGQTTEVEIAYISPTGSVFLHVSETGSKRLEELNHDLTEYYTSKRSKASEFVAKPTEEKICCAKCEDGNWYRAKILPHTDRKAVKVLYVDYGNTEVIQVFDLREPTQDNAHVLSLPFQALECQLYDVPKDGWSDEIVDRIFDIVEDCSLSAEVMSSGELPLVSLLVTLESEGEQVTHRLASLLGLNTEYQDDDVQTVPDDDQKNLDRESGEGLLNGEKVMRNVETDVPMGVPNQGAKAPSRQSETDEEKPPAMEESGSETDVSNREVFVTENVNNAQGGHDQFKEGQPGAQAHDVKVSSECSQWKPLPLPSGWFDVYVTFTTDPDHFTFQLLENDSEICKLTDELNNFYQNQKMESEVSLVEGHVYAAWYTPDECWHRCQMVSVINEDKVYVRFLDYGGEAALEKDDIRELDEKFLDLPFQAVLAKLCGVKTTKKKWSKETLKEFKFLIFERYLVARIKSDHKEYNFDFTTPVTVELCDTEDPARDVFIAEKLIETTLDVAAV